MLHVRNIIHKWNHNCVIIFAPLWHDIAYMQYDDRLASYALHAVNAWPTLHTIWLLGLYSSPICPNSANWPSKPEQEPNRVTYKSQDFKTSKESGSRSSKVKFSEFKNPEKKSKNLKASSNVKSGAILTNGARVWQFCHNSKPKLGFSSLWHYASTIFTSFDFVSINNFFFVLQKLWWILF